MATECRLVVSLRRRRVHEPEGDGRGDGRCVCEAELGGRVRTHGADDGLRLGTSDVRIVQQEQIRFDGRDPVDAEQCVALDDLASLRLLPGYGCGVLRGEEGMRAGAYSVFVR